VAGEDTVQKVGRTEVELFRCVHLHFIGLAITGGLKH